MRHSALLAIIKIKVLKNVVITYLNFREIVFVLKSY
jgi:hypothetical protein